MMASIKGDGVQTLVCDTIMYDGISKTVIFARQREEGVPKNFQICVTSFMNTPT